jgi:hypothetical protein
MKEETLQGESFGGVRWLQRADVKLLLRIARPLPPAAAGSSAAYRRPLSRRSRNLGRNAGGSAAPPIGNECGKRSCAGYDKGFTDLISLLLHAESPEARFLLEVGRVQHEEQPPCIDILDGCPVENFSIIKK